MRITFTLLSKLSYNFHEINEYIILGFDSLAKNVKFIKTEILIYFWVYLIFFLKNTVSVMIYDLIESNEICVTLGEKDNTNVI